MILAARPIYPGQRPAGNPGIDGLGSVWSDISSAVSDSIGKFSTAGATRIIAQPGTTVSTRNADGSSTTISRSGIFNPSPSLGVGLDVPAVGNSSLGTIFILGILGVVVLMTIRK